MRPHGLLVIFLEMRSLAKAGSAAAHCKLLSIVNCYLTAANFHWFQEIQLCGMANQDLVLGWDMVFGLNLSLATFRLTMQSMDFNRRLSTLASATLLPECLITNFTPFVQVSSFLLRSF